MTQDAERGYPQEAGERNRQVYVTADGSAWLALDFPFGLVAPPEVALHRPLVGPARFFHASSFRLPVPPEAEVPAP
jgi:hypothetical protein